MNRLILLRESGYKQKEHQVKGDIYIYNDLDALLFRCVSLELPWRNNQNSISCIYEDLYTAVIHDSPKFGRCLWLQDVKDRSEILTHAANYVGSMNPETGIPDLRGCIAPGMEYKDITGDGIVETWDSRNALNQILSYFEDQKTLQFIVTSKDKYE